MPQAQVLGARLQKNALKQYGPQMLTVGVSYQLLMSHKCEDCGQTFETLTRLRLHDCSANTASEDETTETLATDETESDVVDRRPDAVAIEELDDLLHAIRDGAFDNLYQAMATYETALASAHESASTDSYRGISRAYREQLISALDEATQAKGWPFLEAFIEAYHPDTADDFPHVTTILQNVTGRYLIRTRLTDGIDAVPRAVLDYFETILTDVGELQDFIREGVHPYGWGIGHPDHSVADRLHTHAAADIILVDAILEHAFYADQYAAVEVLERIVRDDSIQHSLSHPTGDISEARALLDAPAGAASDFSPTMPRYWDWEDELGYSFDLAPEVEQRIRDLVVEEGIDDDLPSDWEITDLTL